MTGTLTIQGEQYVVLPVAEYERLVGPNAPKLPDADRHGNRPAREAIRATMARTLLRKRIEAGLTQKQLAEKAGIAPETLCRIETGKHRAQTATLEKVAKALGE